MDKISQENKNNTELIVEQINKMSLNIVQELKLGFTMTQTTQPNNKEKESNKEPIPQEHLDENTIATMTQSTDEQPTDQQKYRHERLHQQTNFSPRTEEVPINKDDNNLKEQHRTKNTLPINKETTREQLLEIIETQRQQINEINARIDNIEQRIQINTKEQRIPINSTKENTYASMLSRNTNIKQLQKIDSEGEELEDSRSEQDKNKPTQYDYTPVRTNRKHLKPRPEMSESIYEYVDKDLRKHKEEKRNNPLTPKPKPETRMSNDKRIDLIQEMLAEDALTIGIAPITREKINRVRNILTSKGTLSKHETAETRTQ